MKIKLGKTFILETTKHGFTLWRSGNWVIDASDILKDNEVLISKEFKKVKLRGDTNITYKLEVKMDDEGTITPDEDE